MRAALRALTEQAFVDYSVQNATGILAWCGGTWWRCDQDAWRPLSHDRDLLPHVQRWATGFVGTNQDPELQQWMWSLSADHRLLPLCRRLRQRLATDSLPISTHPGL